MVHHGLWHVQAIIAGELRPERKIDVLTVAEEFFIEQSDVAEHGSPIQGCPCACTKDRHRVLVWLGIELMYAPVYPRPTGKKVAASRIDNVTTTVHVTLSSG